MPSATFFYVSGATFILLCLGRGTVLVVYRAYAISDYPAVSRHAAAIMHMIMNNLDDRVAQFPQELVTYGGNGQVFSNWAQASHSSPVIQRCRL